MNPKREPLAGSAEVAEYRGKSVRTLDQWAYLGIGPKYVKITRHRRYRWSDVEAWLDAQATEQRQAA